MRSIILSLLLISNGLLFAQSDFETYVADPGDGPREHSADITHMKVELRFDPPAGVVEGVVTHTFSPLRMEVDTLFFDAPGIKIEEALLDDKPCIFKTNSEGVTTYFSTSLTYGSVHTIRFKYTAKPKKGIYFIGWNSPEVTDPKNQTRHQIWTQGQGVDNRYWIPMYDNMNDKFTTETITTFDKEYTVLSNGELKKESTNRDGTKTWHYRMSKPHAGYLLMLAIDKYSVKKSKTSSGVPVAFWYYPESPEKLEPTSMHTEKMIEFLEKETGVKYPWESYSQVMVQDFMYGAMENTTATIFGDFFNVDERSFLDRNYIGVNCHELTHQWFGDLITARGRGDIWLQESYATYYAKMFQGSLYGEDKLKWIQRNEVNTALKASERDMYPIRHSNAGRERVYQKGSTVIQMLRYVLGNELFRKVIKHYLDKHAYSNVETNDLYQAVLDVTGMNLDWFFNQWLYRGGEPHYRVQYFQTLNGVQVNVEQTQEINDRIRAFKMPVVITVHFKNGIVKRKKVMLEKVFESIFIETQGNNDIDFVLFDENSEITKKLTFDKTPRECLAQLAGAAYMIDRYDALLALRDVDIELKRIALWDAYERENLPEFKAAIITQLANDPESQTRLLSLFDSAEPEVIKALINTNRKLNETLTPGYEKALAHTSYEVVESALNVLCETYPDKGPDYLQQVKDVLGHNHSIRIKYLEWMLKFEKETLNSKNELIKLSSNLFEFRTRVSAMQALKRLGIFNDEIIGNLLNAGLSSNKRLSGPAVEVLNYFTEQSANKQQVKNYISIHKYSEDEKKEFRELGY
ncbi:MAG: M1 family metallopeptidase [Flavobacteriales bacterium]|nr:M1 family metallopeptidase [Flavobacteriales bacterium]